MTKSKQNTTLANKKQLLFAHIVPLIAAILIGIAMSVHAGKDVNWDLLNYHYYNPYALLSGTLDDHIAPAQLQTFHNPLIDIPGYLVMTHASPVILGIFLGAIHGLNLWLIYEITLLLLSRISGKRRRGEYLMAAMVALVSFMGVVNRTEIGTTMGDNFVSVPILMSLWLILFGFSEDARISRARRVVWLRYLAFLVVGFAPGAKLTIIPYVVALFVVDMLRMKGLRNTIVSSVKNGLLIVVGFILAYGYWGWHLFKEFGNPFFPYFNGFFHSPYFTETNFFDSRFMPDGFWQAVFYPFYFLQKQSLAAELQLRDPRLAIMVVTLLAISIILLTCILLIRGRGLSRKGMVLFNRVRTKEFIALAVFVAISYALWLKLYSYYRYVQVLEFLSLTLFVGLIWALVQRMMLRLLVIIPVLLVAVVMTVPMDFGRLPWGNSYFGVNLPEGYIEKRAVVLMAGGQPISFLAPSFAKDTVFVRIESNMAPQGTYPTKDYEKYVISTLKDLREEDRPFYAIVTSEEKSENIARLSLENITVQSCKSINSTLSEDRHKDKNYYQLCQLGWAVGDDNQ